LGKNVGLKENGKKENLKKGPSEQGQEPTPPNSQVNLDHSGGRQALSPLHYPWFQINHP